MALLKLALDDLFLPQEPGENTLDNRIDVILPGTT